MAVRQGVEHQLGTKAGREQANVSIDGGAASSKCTIIVNVDVTTRDHEWFEVDEPLPGAIVQVAIQSEKGDAFQPGRRQGVRKPALHHA